MTEQMNKHSKSKFLIPLLVVFGVGVAAAGVYVMNGGDGNQSIEVSANSPDAVAMLALKTKASEIEKSAVGDVAAMLALDEPIQLPVHKFVGPDGTEQTMDQFKGKVLLVNLWATWCAPCREEMPALSELQTAKSGDDFEVVTINIDRGDRTKPDGFLKDIGVDNLALYQDSSMGIFNSLKKEGIAFGLPVTMLLDEDGYVIGSMNGPAHWSSQDALNYIDAAIAAKTN